jgi:hypothetical protein
MIVLAIDPGPVESAWVEYDTVARKALGFGKELNDDVVLRVGYRDGGYSHLAIEMIASYGMPVGAEVFETCVWIGRFAERWGRRNWTPIKRHDVKIHLCHSARAKDGNIRQALIDKFGPPGTKKSPGGTYGISGDVWAALAVAVTFTETRMTTITEPSPTVTMGEAT